MSSANALISMPGTLSSSTGFGERAKAAKKFKATTNSRHNLPVALNLLGQDFTTTAPNQKWVGDITYRAPILRRCH